MLALAAACGSGAHRKAKKGEAEFQLDRIGKALKRRFAEDGGFPAMSVPLPTASCCEDKDPRSGTRKCLPVRGEWAAWSEIDFSIDEPRFYQYSIETTPTTFRVRAVGDLDCDYQTSEFALDGVAVDGNVKVTFTPPARVD